MNPYLESNFLVRLMEEMEEEEELELARHMLIRRRRARNERRHGGSIPGRVRIHRDHMSGDARIRADYFGANPVYTDAQFRRRYLQLTHSFYHVQNSTTPIMTHEFYGRFRMRRHVFERLVDAVQQVDPYFIQRPNCAGEMGLSALQKVVAAVRILAYGIPADAVDEYVRIGESTAHEALKHFCTAVQTAFAPYYLRAPNAEDIARLLQVGESRGFPGMLGSVDCMHWEWRNCPSSWKGMFTGRGKHPTMILEAVASYDLWIWHAYFGLPGSCNDINVLHRSNLFERHLSGDTPPVSFTVNGHTYNMGYYLADGIYPDWPAFVKTIRNPYDVRTQHFATIQESARKDIERAFGVLQKRWGVVRGPAYGWSPEHIGDIMKTCIILHNMIVEDEGPLSLNTTFENIGVLADTTQGSMEERNDFVNQRYNQLKDRNKYTQLQVDLIHHHWARHGSGVA